MAIRPLIYSLPLLALLAGPVRAEEPAAAPGGETTPATMEKPDPEQAIAAALREELKGSEFVTLQVAGKEVLALYQTQTRSKALGGVVLLHDINGNPDWPVVIQTLRRALPDAGWNTLSLQLPLVDSPQTTVEQLDAIRQRLEAALQEMRRRKIDNIVLIGHGQGALAALDLLAGNLTPGVVGVVAISLDGSVNDNARLDGAKRLGAVTLPILDIYGTRDNRAVVESAKRRYDLARKQGSSDDTKRPAYSDIARRYTPGKAQQMTYRQIALSGADHQFNGLEQTLAKRVRGWLTRFAGTGD